MNRTELQETYLELLKHLWVEFVFYIPDTPIFIEALKHIDLFTNKRHFNTVFVLDYYKGPIFLKEDRDNSKTILKNAALEQNIFELLKKRGELETYEFNYILEKYLEQIEALSYIANWLAENLITFIKYDSNISGLFKLQQTNYQAHLNTFIQHFSSKKGIGKDHNPDLENLLKAHYTNLKNVISKGQKVELNSSLQEDKLTDTETTQNTTKIRSKIKKQPLISQDEAEISILKSVFKVGG
ncbi:hypothetical protein RBH94_11945 [Aestuariibaculum sp. YM273]|uniref:hypothetical protein n=1 Tax=Aestuariibaculum sp. YM273 TaxID=3070659 RepID=UPI0027DC5530|nr:hypothetical protein [Aestuariibaculum sp. YM273]WMI64770.1 hypothetical protein RBH94_11945 [Aestuariibaculum sp. YM273]